MVARVTANRADGFVGKVAWSARSVYSQKRGINPTHLGPLTTGQAIKFFPVGLYYNVIDRIKSPVFGITLSDPLTRLATANGAGLEQTRLTQPKPENIMLSTGASTGSGSADKPKLVKATIEKRGLRLIPNMATSLLYGIAAGSFVPTATIVAANMLSAATIVEFSATLKLLPIAYPLLAATGLLINIATRLLKHQGIKNAFTNRINLALATFGVVSFAATSAPAILASILPASFIVSTAFATIMIALPFVIGGLPLALHIGSIIRNKADKETIDIDNQPAAVPVAPEATPVVTTPAATTPATTEASVPTVYENSVAGLDQALKDLRLELAKGATADADALSHLRNEAKRIGEQLKPKGRNNRSLYLHVDLDEGQKEYVIVPKEPESRITKNSRNKIFTYGQDIGFGGMAQIYLAMDLETGKYHAIKWRTSSESNAAERFRKEAQEIMVRGRELAESTDSNKKLAATRIVPVYALSGDLFFVMEYEDPAEGWQTLSETLQANHLAVETVINIIKKILDTMHYLNFSHRDLKPSNVFYNTNTGEIKIGDFGLIKTKGEGLSSTNIAPGTPSHAAPYYMIEYGIATRKTREETSAMRVTPALFDKTILKPKAGQIVEALKTSGYTNDEGFPVTAFGIETRAGFNLEGFNANELELIFRKVLSRQAGYLDTLLLKNDLYAIGCLLFELLSNRSKIVWRGKEKPTMLKSDEEDEAAFRRKNPTIEPIDPNELLIRYALFAGDPLEHRDVIQFFKAVRVTSIPTSVLALIRQMTSFDPLENLSTYLEARQALEKLELELQRVIPETRNIPPLPEPNPPAMPETTKGPKLVDQPPPLPAPAPAAILAGTPFAVLINPDMTNLNAATDVLTIAENISDGELYPEADQTDAVKAQLQTILSASNLPDRYKEAIELALAMLG